MPIYVDPILDHQWQHGPSCHMFTDETSLYALHAFAQAIGMRRAWFQDSPRAPHYDLTRNGRLAAVRAGAVEVTRRQAVEIWRTRRAAMAMA